MNCKNICKLCDHLVISDSVTFVTRAPATLVINLPAGSYRNGEKFCIVVAQAIPEATTINAPVAITIGDGADRYPLLTRCGAQVTASALSTRTRYATRVVTNSNTGSFRLLGDLHLNTNPLPAIDGGAPTP